MNKLNIQRASFKMAIINENKKYIAKILLLCFQTTYATSYLLYNLGQNQEAQNTLYKESCALLPNKNSSVTKNTLANCPYARAALKESFRLNPISVGVGRILDTDAAFSGYEVPKGVISSTFRLFGCLYG